MASPPRRLPTAAVAIVVRGHSALTATPAVFSSADRPEHAHAHAELRHGVGGGVFEPFRLHVERRRQHQNMRVFGLLQMRDTIFRHHEGAARVDTHHQVEPLHVGCLRIGQADGAGVVDADIDAAEFADGFIDRRDHLSFVADVAENRQRLAAGGADLVGGGVDGALEFRVRLCGLRCDRDIGAVACRAQRDREPDAPAGAGYEQRLALERCHRPSLRRFRADRACLAYCPAASAPRVRGSGAPSNPFAVTAIEFAEVCPIGSITRWPLARSAASVSSAKPRSIRTSSGSH